MTTAIPWQVFLDDAAFRLVSVNPGAIPTPDTSEVEQKSHIYQPGAKMPRVTQLVLENATGVQLAIGVSRDLFPSASVGDILRVRLSASFDTSRAQGFFYISEFDIFSLASPSLPGSTIDSKETKDNKLPSVHRIRGAGAGMLLDLTVPNKDSYSLWVSSLAPPSKIVVWLSTARSSASWTSLQSMESVAS